MPPAYPSKHHTVFVNSTSPQNDSALFSTIPSEIRSIIFTYALASYATVDPNKAYRPDAVYTRPEYTAPHIPDVALLSTCQAVYHESWWRLWENAQHTFWLTALDRSPLTELQTRKQRLLYGDKSAAPRRIQPAQHSDFQQRLRALFISRPEPSTTPSDESSTVDKSPPVELGHARIFPQLYMLEPGNALNQLYKLPHFHPRCITITLRHTDWWFWENDHHLFIRSGFVNKVRLPRSCKVFCMELESLERKKAQIDYVAAQMCDDWQFSRAEDNMPFRADSKDCETTTWEGSSMWHGQRWVRDEVDERPEKLSYYVKTVLSESEYKRPHAAEIHVPTALAQTTRAPNAVAAPGAMGVSTQGDFLNNNELVQALVPAGTPASEARQMVADWKERRRQRYVRETGFRLAHQGPPGGFIPIGDSQANAQSNSPANDHASVQANDGSNDDSDDGTDDETSD
ncbi:uncharacterized protein AB675_709 [Cyphellophora attinorum]|uniref:Uncharacterized protein n=1 Tax=Cyphellophora attinorum TaxID=1664694 RepID=A0A0N0NS24_9EURO|nr:uncharacterized protein AB675_709 [Phialophora attinorum]KPI45761.1 hypothetical protein AB675_709 [Phialophora attinorum]